MEEKLEFYEKYLIPVLKKKIYDVQAVLSDMEAHILYLKEKVASLQSERDSLKEKVKGSGDNYEQ